MFQPQIISACCYKYFAVKKQETLHNIRQYSRIFTNVFYEFEGSIPGLLVSSYAFKHIIITCWHCLQWFRKTRLKKMKNIYLRTKIMRVFLLQDCKIIYSNNNIPYDFQNFSNFDLVFKNFENYCGTCSLITMFLLLKQITFYRLWPIQD